VKKLLRDRNIHFITDCSQLKGETAGSVTKHFTLPTGGSILAIFDCWSEHYEPAVTCSGYQDLLPSQHMPHASPAETKPFLSHSELQHAVQSAHNISAGGSVPDVYTCYNDSSTKEFPLERMWSYLDNVTLAGPPSDGRLYTAQGIWQESATTVIIGEAEGSTLLLDETRSGLNALLTARIKGGKWNVSRINFVEINNVCDGGPELLQALRAL